MTGGDEDNDDDDDSGNGSNGGSNGDNGDDCDDYIDDKLSFKFHTVHRSVCHTSLFLTLC